MHLNFSTASCPLVLNGMPAYSSMGSLTTAVSGSQTSVLGVESLLPQAKKVAHSARVEKERVLVTVFSQSKVVICRLFTVAKSQKMGYRGNLWFLKVGMT